MLCNPGQQGKGSRDSREDEGISCCACETGVSRCATRLCTGEGHDSTFVYVREDDRQGGRRRGGDHTQSHHLQPSHKGTPPRQRTRQGIHSDGAADGEGGRVDTSSRHLQALRELLLRETRHRGELQRSEAVQEGWDGCERRRGGCCG